MNESQATQSLTATASTAPTEAAAASTADWTSTLLPMVLILAVLYFLMIRPQRKKDKQVQAMRKNIEIGDMVTTVGGIVGIVVSLKDDNLVIETAGERNKIRIKRWAVHSNETLHETT